VYLGVRAEKASTSAAVADTAGQVLTAAGVIANTIYNPVAGGASESNQYAYTAASGALVARPVPYLQGSSDRAPDGTPYDAASSAASWHTAAYPVEVLSAIMAGDPRTNVGMLSAVDLSKRGVSGRLYAVTLVGSLGVRTVSGDVFRIVFNKYKPSTDPILRSNLVDLAPIP
jgi:peptidoglycan hydrolase-like amidase